MARKKQEEEVPSESALLMSTLLKGTSKAQVVSNTGMMHGRLKVKTPIPSMNAFLGGGLPLGVMVEAFGDPSSGKSSWAYQTLGIFQKEYPTGIAIIVDTEASVEELRMRHMGCNPDTILRIPSDTIEVGFSEVFKILDNKLASKELKDVPLFILWDTISLASTQKQFENKDNPNGGGNYAVLVA